MIRRAPRRRPRSAHGLRLGTPERAEDCFTNRRSTEPGADETGGGTGNRPRRGDACSRAPVVRVIDDAAALFRGTCVAGAPIPAALALDARSSRPARARSAEPRGGLSNVPIGRASSTTNERPSRRRMITRAGRSVGITRPVPTPSLPRGRPPAVAVHRAGQSASRWSDTSIRHGSCKTPPRSGPPVRTQTEEVIR